MEIVPAADITPNRARRDMLIRLQEPCIFSMGSVHGAPLGYAATRQGRNAYAELDGAEAPVFGDLCSAKISYVIQACETPFSALPYD